MIPRDFMLKNENSSCEKRTFSNNSLRDLPGAPLANTLRSQFAGGLGLSTGQGARSYMPKEEFACHS